MHHIRFAGFGSHRLRTIILAVATAAVFPRSQISAGADPPAATRSAAPDEALAKARRFLERARVVAETAHDRDSIYGEIGGDLALARDAKAAKATVDEIRDLAFKSFAFSSIAMQLAETGEYDAAAVFARDFCQPADRVRCQLAIALGQFNKGDREAAARSIENAKDLSVRLEPLERENVRGDVAVTEILCGDIEAGLRDFERVPPPSLARVFKAAFLAQWRAKDLIGAKKTVELADRLLELSPTGHGSLAAARALLGDSDAVSVKARRSPGDTSTRSAWYLEIARLDHDAGSIDAAADALALAKEAAVGEPPSMNRWADLTHVAMLQLEFGDRESGLASLNMALAARRAVEGDQPLPTTYPVTPYPTATYPTTGPIGSWPPPPTYPIPHVIYPPTTEPAYPTTRPYYPTTLPSYPTTQPSTMPYPYSLDDLRNNYTTDLAVGFANAHQWEAARALLPFIAADSRVGAARMITTVQVRSGDVKGVAAWIDGLDDPSLRAYSLLGAADGLLPKCSLEIAIGLMNDEGAALQLFPN